MERAVPSICGQLVSIGQGNKVHMIHETAREFLLSDNHFSVLFIRKAQHSHTSCLSHIAISLPAVSSRPQPKKRQPTTRAPRFGKQAAAITLDSSFLSYASRFFSDHHYTKVPPENDELMEQLYDFLLSADVLCLDRANRAETS